MLLDAEYTLPIFGSVLIAPDTAVSTPEAARNADRLVKMTGFPPGSLGEVMARSKLAHLLVSGSVEEHYDSGA